MPSAGALSYLTVKPPEPLSYGAPTVDFSGLERIPKSYQEGQQYARQRALQTAFDQGAPRNPDGSINTGAITDTLFRLGGAETAAPIAQKLIGADIYRQMMGGQGGGQPGQLSQLESGGQPAQPTSGGSSVDPRGKIPVIVAAAQKYGVDPRTAIRVAQSEGLKDFYGDNGRSGTAFQLYTKGGLGNEFQKETGLDPLDPKNEDAAIDWAMKNVARTGWSPYKGAAKVGIGHRQGIGVAPTQTAAAGGGGAVTNAPAPVEQPPGAMGTPPFMGTQETGGTGPAASNVGSGPANIQLASTSPETLVNQGAAPQAAQPAPAEQPAQVAQAQPPGQASNIPSARYTPEAADRLDQAAAALRRSAGALSASGFPAETAKAQLDQADNFSKQASEIRSFLAERSKEQYGVGIAGQKVQAEQYAKQYQALGNAALESDKERQKAGVAKQIMSDPSYVSGFGAGRALNFQRAVAAFDPSQANVAQPQEVMKKFFSDSLRSKIVALSQSGVGRIMRSEVSIMEKANASQENSIASNRTLVEIDDRANKLISGLTDAADKYADSHGGNLDSAWNRVAREYVKNNPMFTDQELKDSKLLAAPQMPAGLKTRAEVDDWASKMQLQPNEPVRMPNGKYQYWKGQ